MRILINTMVVFVLAHGLYLSVVASQQDSSEERVKREKKHAEIDKLSKLVARQVRDNEKNWGLQGSTRGSGAPNKDKKSIVYVHDSWRNDDDSVEVNGVLHDAIDAAQRMLLSYVASRAVGPEKEERIAGLGDQALLLEYPDNSQLIFSKGTHFVSVTVKTSDRTKSTETAKRFAKYYEQAIASTK